MPQAIVDSNGAMDYRYTYDSMGNLKSTTDHLDAAYNITNMMYDGLDRLTSAKGFWGDVSIGYDTLGNITSYNFTDKGTTSYQYNTDNLLTAVAGGVSRSFSYDNRGNVTANGKNTFTHNQANRMAASNVADYTYDGHGRRVKTTSANGTEYSFYDKAGRLVYREKADGQDINYVFLNKLQVAKVKGATASKPAKQTALTTQQSLNTIYGTPTYIHTDLLGSPVVESSQYGQVNALSRMHYRPFGETKETPKDEVGYIGHKFDTDIGLVYAQQRYYDPAIGKLYANDPLGFRDVHSFNRYAYANNNPFKFTDPDGRNAKSFGRAVKALTKGLRPSGGDTLDLAIELMDAGFSAEEAMAFAENSGNATVDSVKGNTGSSNGKRAGKKHTRAAIKVAKKNNAAMNGGDVTCTTCGVKTTEPTQRTKGSTVKPTEAQGDHTAAKSKGGNGATVKDQSNINIKCAACNNKKSDN